MTARLGFRNNDGEITTVPTQYADGSNFHPSSLNSSTLFFFDRNNFTALPAGYPTLASIPQSGLQAELEALIGSSGVIGSASSVLNSLGLSSVPAPITVFDHFLGAALDTATWSADTNGTASDADVLNTGLTTVSLVTGTDDNGFGTIASATTFLSSSSLLLAEARLKVDDIQEVGIEFGFSDAASETAGMAFSSHDSTPVAVASNAVVFGFIHDTGGSEVGTTWNASRVNATTAARTAIASGPVNGTFALLQLALALNDDEVDATWFINGVAVATATDVVALNIPLYLWATAKTFEASDSKTVEIDYIRVAMRL